MAERSCVAVPSLKVSSAGTCSARSSATIRLWRKKASTEHDSGRSHKLECNHLVTRGSWRMGLIRRGAAAAW